MTEWLLNIVVVLAIIMLLVSVVTQITELYLTWKRRKEQKMEGKSND